MTPLLLPLLLACGGDEPVPIADTAIAFAEDDPAAYDAEAYAGDRPELDAYDQAAIEAALDAAVATALSANAAPVLAAYDASIAHADAGCPSTYELDGNAFWYDYCYSDDGAAFDGYGFYYAYTDVDLDGSGSSWDGAALYGEARITAPDSSVFNFGGAAVALAGVSADGSLQVWQSTLEGGFTWDADEARGTWLDEGLSPSMAHTALLLPEYGLRGVVMAGGMGGLTDEDGVRLDAPTVILEDVAFLDTFVGFPCGSEPSGIIAVRTDAGTWFDVVFDVVQTGDFAWEMADGGQCDGCGAVYRGDELVGEACADFDDWLDWGDAPW